MENSDLYKGLKEIAEKQLREIHQKGSMSASEAEAAKTAMCLIEMCEERIGDDDGYSERGSRRSYTQPYRHYTIDSYSDGRSMRNRSYDDGMYMRDGYAMDSYREESYRNRDRLGRYSSHSIDDRVVDMLEKMVDSAKSDYEHQKLMEYIRYVRSNEARE